MKILNVIVFYNNKDEVEQYLEEVNNISDNNIDVAIIINSDCEKNIEKLKIRVLEKYNFNISFFDYDENVGYLNALFRTITQISLDKYIYIILSNTDIRYKSKDFFKVLLRKRYDNIIGCIAPNVYATQSNSYSNPHYISRIPKRKLLWLKQIFTFPIIAKIYLMLAELKAHIIKHNELKSQFVYSPHGCYMIFTNDFIKKICGYEYGVKLYSEESCIGELLMKNMKRCYYDDELKIEHYESTVTGKMNQKNRFHEWKKSIEYILDTFYN